MIATNYNLPIIIHIEPRCFNTEIFNHNPIDQSGEKMKKKNYSFTNYSLDFLTIIYRWYYLEREKLEWVWGRARGRGRDWPAKQLISNLTKIKKLKSKTINLDD